MKGLLKKVSLPPAFAAGAKGGAGRAAPPIIGGGGGAARLAGGRRGGFAAARRGGGAAAGGGGGGGGGPEDGAQRLVVTLEQNFFRDVYDDDPDLAEDDTIRTYPTTNTDIQITVQGYVEETGMWVDQKRVDIDVDRRLRRPAAGSGGGIEFLSGYDGIGSGGSAAGGHVAIFNIDSLGTYTPSNASAIIMTVFRKPINISAGGGT